MIKLLIFDLDGTLADTLPSITRAVNLAAEECGYTQKTYEDVRAAIGNGAKLLIKRMMPAEDSEDEAKFQRFFDAYEAMYDKTYLEADVCYDGMSEALSELHKRGYTIAVLSNKQDAYVKPIARQLIPDDILAFAAGQREEYPKKPDPTVPLMIAEKFGCSTDEVAFIGDSDVDILTARNSGMMSIGCDWGYRSREALEACEADMIISAPMELLEVFK